MGPKVNTLRRVMSARGEARLWSYLLLHPSIRTAVASKLSLEHHRSTRRTCQKMWMVWKRMDRSQLPACFAETIQQVWMQP